ncbi:MAG: DUF2924 domain-containing protein [Paracoccaceae bacterium]
MSRFKQDLAALDDMSPTQLRERWAEIDKRQLPNVPPKLMRSLVAYRLQERRHGGLPKLVRRELMRLAAEGRGSADIRKPKTKLSAGARLIREWNGQTISVEVLEGRFRYADKTWNSLSEIARHITGTQWSGPRFFGLTANG